MQSSTVKQLYLPPLQLLCQGLHLQCVHLVGSSVMFANRVHQYTMDYNGIEDESTLFTHIDTLIQTLYHQTSEEVYDQHELDVQVETVMQFCEYLQTSPQLSAIAKMDLRSTLLRSQDFQADRANGITLNPSGICTWSIAERAHASQLRTSFKPWRGLQQWQEK